MARDRKTIPAITSKFLKIKCPDCASEQVTFNRATVKVHCQACGATLLEPTGGVADIKDAKAEVLE
ncbi:MAG TPA: 30S ribosomal protein S27e [Candidatus Thermoplasmatota archaeon]|nr:30S ribosomal protein S27e [Candidatus Thermoplasmatota archaeon]